jgi:hypothetical protein
MIAGLLQQDVEAGRRWLSFSRPPPMEIRRELVDAGWRYHGGHCAWSHVDASAPIPAPITLGRGGACSYSTQRAVHGPAILELLARARGQIAAAHYA